MTELLSARRSGNNKSPATPHLLSPFPSLDQILDWQASCLGQLLVEHGAPRLAPDILMGIVHHMHGLALDWAVSDLPFESHPVILDIRVYHLRSLWRQPVTSNRVRLVWHFQNQIERSYLAVTGQSFPVMDTATAVAALFDLLPLSSDDLRPWAIFNAYYFRKHDGAGVYDWMPALKHLANTTMYTPAMVSLARLQPVHRNKDASPPKLLVMAAGLGDMEANAELSEWYARTGNGTAAARYQRSAAIMGHNRSLLAVGLALYRRHRHEEAFAHFLIAARQGDPAGIVWTCFCLARGLGCIKNPSLALSLVSSLQFCIHDSRTPYALPVSSWPIIPGTCYFDACAFGDTIDASGWARSSDLVFTSTQHLIPLRHISSCPQSANTSSFSFSLYCAFSSDLFLSLGDMLVSLIGHAFDSAAGLLDLIDQRAAVISNELSRIESRFSHAGDYDSCVIYENPTVETSVPLAPPVGARLAALIERSEQFGRRVDQAWLSGSLMSDQKELVLSKGRGLIQSVLACE